MKKTWLTLLVIVFLPISVWAEAPVEDANAVSAAEEYYPSENANPDVPLSQDNSSSTYSSETSFNPNDPASLIAKINAMQTEIQRLRGKLEIQSHEIQSLKTQQQAYYNDLDQRISMLSSNTTGKKTSQPVLSLDDSTDTALTSAPSIPVTEKTNVKTAIPSSAATPIPVTTTPNPKAAMANSTDETARYNAAYAFIEQKKFPDAVTTMNAFLKDYPDGQYAANAHYWLGELSFAQHQDEKAIQEFSIVVDRYSTSSKVSASLLKQGLAYANLGKISDARISLLKVQKLFPNTISAQLAEQRLKTLPAPPPTGVPSYH